MRFIFLLLAMAVLSACDQHSAAELEVRDVVLYAPVTTGTPAVAYFVVRNNSSLPIQVHRVDSQLFARAEFHATVVSDGLSRMQSVDELHIDTGAEVRLQPGGVHLMLMRAHNPVTAADRDTLTIYYGENKFMTIETPVSDRLAVPAALQDSP
jgi:periplasmic copper chaperone A